MKILAVDDDPIILELLTQFMDAVGGHELVTAESGAEALEVIEQHAMAPFECFLLDIQMPGMDGVELVRAIRALKAHAHTPAIMLTAMSEKRYIDSAFAAGATDYVTKPFEVTELKTRLGLVQRLVPAAQPSTKKIFAATPQTEAAPLPTQEQEIALFEPISIPDVDNVIRHTALENYVTQLSRNSLFGSTIFAFSVRRIESFYDALSGFEFRGLLADTAEVISNTMQGHQFLMSYAGNGIFVVVTESGWRPDMEKLKDAVNLALAQTEIYDNSGERLQPRVVTGKPIRLVWKVGSSILQSLADAHSSAEEAAVRKEQDLGNIWMVREYG
ncbi:response regulator [Sulfitobacter sp. TSTF-M16]|uniref:Response regulator n=2 Tax=Sulfitobacter aestuariivivens TaxID=2766981 RepID=A0A927HCI4_9RHOB|nr:response regulator [Sulfitobacter aestuariivivens]